jgi:hypothetical protein
VVGRPPLVADRSDQDAISTVGAVELSQGICDVVGVGVARIELLGRVAVELPEFAEHDRYLLCEGDDRVGEEGVEAAVAGTVSRATRVVVRSVVAVIACSRGRPQRAPDPGLNEVVAVGVQHDRTAGICRQIG